MIDSTFGYIFVIGCSIFGIVWGGFNVLAIRKVNMDDHTTMVAHGSHDNEGVVGQLKEKFLGGEGPTPDEKTQKDLLARMKHLANLIERGAISFLHEEYIFLSIYLFFFAIILYFVAEPSDVSFPYTTLAFIIGCLTSIACGYIGMRVAVYTNVRTTKECCTSIHHGFVVAYRGGQVLGFVLVGLALLILQVLIIIYKGIYLTNNPDVDSTTISDENVEDVSTLFEMIAGYGLGGSTVALFGRVGGGIYTKAADVGSDLAGKVVEGLPEDDPSNPGVIADNVGDNVGDIAGMGSDLFGSLAESTCAALVVAGTCKEIITTQDSIYFPLMITSMGIIVSFITQFHATLFAKVTMDNVETTVKWQLIISTVLMTIFIYPLTYFLPTTFNVAFSDTSSTTTTPMDAFICIVCGLWSGFLIGWITEVYTSNAYTPVQELAEACRMGAAPNIILGLALGYMSNIIPILCIAITIYVSFTLASMYGIALSALGMLGCLPIALAIDGYGPISDNAGGIAEMTGLHPSIRKMTDQLDAAGNTTAAIGKGFAIGSACLVSLALFGAYLTRIGQNTVDIMQPLTFSGLLVGAMLPYAFSALTMSAVGQAASEMIDEIRRQFSNPQIKNREIDPDYDRCIAISTKASIKKMVAPGLLVIGTPLFVGFVLGTTGVAGVLAGSIVSGVQIAFSFSNTGGAWDNAKKYVEANKHHSKVLAKEGIDYIFTKNTEAHAAAVCGDTVGDPLKDTSGPSINILIKLSAITSLVFGTAFTKYTLGLGE